MIVSCKTGTVVMTRRSIRIVLVDDHAVVRAGFRRLLDEAADMQVVAEGESGEEAYQAYLRHRPDVAVLDIAMPGIGGLSAIRRIMTKDKNARILVLSVYEDPVLASRVLQSGALGYLTKRCVPELLIEAVRVIADGKQFLDREIAQELAFGQMSSKPDPFKNLSEREFEVFCMLAKGVSVNDIAALLCLSPKTVGTYQTHILKKLGVSNSVSLARLAIRRGLIEA